MIFFNKKTLKGIKTQKNNGNANTRLLHLTFVLD